MIVYDTGMDKPKLSRSEVEVVGLDWDMTCVDSHGKILQNMAIAHEFDNPLTEDEVRQHWNKSSGFIELMSRLTNGVNLDMVMKVVDRDYNRPEFAKQSFSFTEPTLQRLRHAGFNLAIISGVQRSLLHADAETLGINLDDFDFIQAQDDYEF